MLSIAFVSRSRSRLGLTLLVGCALVLVAACAHRPEAVAPLAAVAPAIETVASATHVALQIKPGETKAGVWRVYRRDWQGAEAQPKTFMLGDAKPDAQGRVRYDDTRVKTGMRYDYHVYPIDAQGKVDVKGERVAGPFTLTPPPAPPEGVSAERGADVVRLFTKAPPTGYGVWFYRDPGQDLRLDAAPLTPEPTTRTLVEDNANPPPARYGARLVTREHGVWLVGPLALFAIAPGAGAVAAPAAVPAPTPAAEKPAPIAPAPAPVAPIVAVAPEPNKDDKPLEWLAVTAEEQGVHLRWQGGPSPLMGYWIERRAAADKPEAFHPVGYDTPHGMGYMVTVDELIDTALPAQGDYVYRLVARSRTGRTVTSPEASVTYEGRVTKPAPGAKPAPTPVAAPTKPTPTLTPVAAPTKAEPEKAAPVAAPTKPTPTPTPVAAPAKAEPEKAAPAKPAAPEKPEAEKAVPVASPAAAPAKAQPAKPAPKPDKPKAAPKAKPAPKKAPKKSAGDDEPALVPLVPLVKP